MRRALVLVSLLAVVVAIAEAQTQSLDPSFRSDEGYGLARWGMSPSEVMALYPNGISVPRGIVVRDQEVADKKASLTFIFADGRLVVGGPVFAEEYVNKRRYVYDYSELKNLLIEKYGTPVKDEVIWHNSLFRTQPEEWGTAISAGHLTMFSIWQTPHTRIELSVNGEKFKVALRIRYASTELADLLKKQQQSDKLKGL